MSVKITRPGMFSTIQDLGRIGHRSVGIGPGGAMDFFAASVANYLTGNDATAAVLEMHFPAAEMLFESDALIAITGADFDARLNDQPVAFCQPVRVEQQSVLSFKKIVSGARVYVSVQGGWTADQWLNSYSTHVKIKAGGFNGRPLLKNDVIGFNAPTALLNVDNFDGMGALIKPVYETAGSIRCIEGPEFDQLDPSAKKTLISQSFKITAQSDRMGFRLQGPSIAIENQVELISSPVDEGIIQLLPNGQLIVLMADHQTTGGYPRIASIIRADLPKLAQLPIHALINFQLVTMEVAMEALFSLDQSLTSIKNYCDRWYAADGHQL